MSEDDRVRVKPWYRCAACGERFLVGDTFELLLLREIEQRAVRYVWHKCKTNTHTTLGLAKFVGYEIIPEEGE